MRLSAPVHQLKRRAKALARNENIPHHAALDRVAAGEGFATWSLLLRKASGGAQARTLLEALEPGDLVLIGARPGHGKTLFSLQLAAHAAARGRRSVFFSLEYTAADVAGRLRALGVEPGSLGNAFLFDGSDRIDAGYIAQRLSAEPQGTLGIVDYMQLLDRRRDGPDLAAQIGRLKTCARERGHVIALLSQIDRSYDPRRSPVPGLGDVRLANPLELSVFTKACFMHDGQMRLHPAH